MTRLLTVLVLLLTAGCSDTVPLSGETSDGEKFSGTFSRRTDGVGGKLALGSDRGAICEGRWHLDEDHTGSMVFTCRDGRTGTAELSGRQADGTMKGMLGGKPFKGAFEDPMLPAAR